MSKHVHNCIDEILDRITIIEKRLDEMEKMVVGHVLNDKVHLKPPKSYKPKNRASSPPPPPSGNYNTKTFKQLKVKRVTSAPARIQTPVNIQGSVPVPPPLPTQLKL